MSTQERPVIALTMGDPNGIGLEVLLTALKAPAVQASAQFIVVAPRSLLSEYQDQLGLDSVLEGVETVDIPLSSGTELQYGTVSEWAGRLAMESVLMACDLCLSGRADAMVTAPISKEAILLAGYEFSGHTEFLAQRTGAERFVMMLVSGSLRVALLTIHEPLARVAGLITQERILKTLETLARGLKTDFDISDPRVAVLGLNPHAGEGGVIGREEIDIIQPALEAARASGVDVAGPFPADGFFGRRLDKEFDAVLAMYHDQGLAPFKALAMGAGVNVTLGLPIVRASPDHGTAFGIAGQGIASADSMIEAIMLAADIAQRRSRVRTAGSENG